jgi:hypothetical protein
MEAGMERPARPNPCADGFVIRSVRKLINKGNKKKVMETNKEKDKSQGKRSTAETDMTYNQDAEELRKSATSSQADVDSGGSIGAGGGRVEAIRENRENKAAGNE